MKLNQVGSPKSHRLLQEGVIDPIRALNAGPVTELRGVLQALAGGGPEGRADAETARRLHGEVVATMKTILDQMSQWESFVDVVNQVAEVIKMQQKVLKATEKARESRTQEVFDEQALARMPDPRRGRPRRACSSTLLRRPSPARAALGPGRRRRRPSKAAGVFDDEKTAAEEKATAEGRPKAGASPTATRSASPRRTSPPR